MNSTTGTIRVLAGMAAALAVSGFMSGTQAGRIVSIPSASGAAGYGGWNLDNVTITVPAGSFNPATGDYTIGPAGLYQGDVDDTAGSVTAIVLAKDWPAGEPPGLKIVNDDALVRHGKPENCIIATSYREGHYLDTGDPQQVICSSPFQSHKRYKVAMLPATIDATGSGSVDLVFNVEAEAGARDYQVFQKINNWTGKRLAGFTIQAGFGVGAGFQTVSRSGVPLASLSVSVPASIWDADDLATFSHGLFGPADMHFPNDGFFDDVRAGFQIDEYPVLPGILDTLTATRTLAPLNGSNYADVPTGAGAGAGQFGTWLPNIWLPLGIFFDDDNNPDTDDQLVAWYGYNPATQDYQWMYGGNNVIGAAFGTVSAQHLADWSTSAVYYVGEIDDLVNIGLNYLVTIGDISTFPASASNTFTIRITPAVDASGTGAPGYVGRLPSGSGRLVVTDSINPGDDIHIVVEDPDLNADAVLVEMTAVTVDNGATGEQSTVNLTESGPDSAVFTGILSTYERNSAAVPPARGMGVAGGDTLTTTYEDERDAAGKAVTLSADTNVVDLVADSDGGGGGGGGCHAATAAGADPILPLLVLLSLACLVQRRHNDPPTGRCLRNAAAGGVLRPLPVPGAAVLTFPTGPCPESPGPPDHGHARFAAVGYP